MASVVTEHVLLLVPVFIVMMVFALVANTVVANYSTQQKMIVIDSAENQLATTISQLYFTLCQSDISDCVVTKTVPLPEMIDGQTYIVNGTLSENMLTLTFYFPGIPLKDSTVVNLGPNAQWVNDGTAHQEFSSMLTNSVIRAEKSTIDGYVLIKFSFG